MRVLVTGGAGYIGSVVSEALLRAGHEVVVYDNLSHGFAAAVPEGARFVHGDIADAETLGALLSGQPFDAALHFAAFIEAGESMIEPFKYFRNNVAKTVPFLETLLTHGVNRLVFSSTAAVYAASNDPLTETSRIEPANLYGESKLMIEHMLMWLNRTRGLHYAALRYFNAGGATASRGEDHKPETHLVPRVLDVALGLAPHVAVFGTDYPTRDGTCVRDYIHVSDLATAHLLALDALKDKAQMTYNLGTGTGYTVREVIETCREVTGRPILAIDQPRRPGDAPILVASADAIRRDLGWTPLNTLRDIVASAWEWRQAHPNGYAPATAAK